MKRPQPQITQAAKCRICGRHIPPPVPIIGKSREENTARYLQILTEHLKVHEQGLPLVAAVMAGNEVANIAMLANFETTDPEILHHRDFARWRIHSMTRAVLVSDDKITAKVETLQLDTDTAAKVTALLLEMRDVIEERGRYSVPQPTPADLVGHAHNNVGMIQRV